MSLKAYDGMMTRNGVKYIQDKVKEHLEEFKQASKKQLAKGYADSFVLLVDNKHSLVETMEFESHREVNVVENLKKIKITEKTTISSYLFQSVEILSKAYFTNRFTVQLPITLECHDDKTLVYPAILVNEHREILLKFLEDYYCQNQSDAPEDVPEDEWKQREKDWYAFDETQHYTMKILLFDPDHYWNNIVNFFRGEELTQAILDSLPTDEKRKRIIARNNVIDRIEKEAKDKGEKISFWSVIDRLSDKNNTEIDDYMKENEIVLTKIDADFIENALLLDYEPKKEEKDLEKPE